MYSQLGDIVFEGLLGFSQQDDEVSAVYAEHALIESKPRLARTGSSLREFSLAIKFHVAFCNPEEQYDKLDTAREDGTVLPFIYGNGFYEGDYIIEKLKRTVQQTDDTGNYVEITCELNIKEFYDPNKLITKQQRAQLSGFAVDVDRPTPVPTPKLDNTLSAQLYGAQQEIRKFTSGINNKIQGVQNQLNEYLGAPTAIISMGQQLVNVGNKVFAEIDPMSYRINAGLSKMTTLLTNSSALYSINPTLASTVSGGGAIVTAFNTALAPMNTLPVVTNATQGQYCLDVFNGLKNAMGDLNNLLKNIQSDFSPFAIFIASRKIRL